MRLKIFLIMLIVLSSLVSAVHLEDMNAAIAAVKGKTIPQPFKMLFGNERINVYVGEERYNVETNNGLIMGFAEGLSDDPTMNVYTSDPVIDRILNSDSKASAFKDALDNKDVIYEGVGVGKKMKFWFMRRAATIYNWGMLIFG